MVTESEPAELAHGTRTRVRPTGRDERSTPLEALLTVLRQREVTVNAMMLSAVVIAGLVLLALALAPTLSAALTAAGALYAIVRTWNHRQR